MFARIVSDMAVDVVSGDPAALFHPTIASQFVAVPDGVAVGWRRDPDTGVWSAPAPATPLPELTAEALKVSPIEFKLLFTLQERLAINKVRDTDPVLDDFFGLIDDPRLTFVDLGLQSTRDAIGYLAEQGLIGAERVAQILAGVMQ